MNHFIKLWFYISAALLFWAILTTDKPLRITSTWVFEITLIVIALVLFAIENKLEAK